MNQNTSTRSVHCSVYNSGLALPPLAFGRMLRRDQVGFGFSMALLWIVIYVVSYLLFPLLKYWDGDWVGLPTFFNRDAIPTSILWAVAGLLAFAHGYGFNPFNPLRRGQILNATLRRDRLWFMWLGTLGAASVIPLWEIRTQGIDFLLYHREEAFRGEGITLFLFTTLINYSAIFALLLFKYRKSKVIVVIELIFITISTFGSRGLLVVFLLGLGLIASQEATLTRIHRYRESKLLVPYLVAGFCVFLTFGLVFVRQSQSVNIPNLKHAVSNTFEEGETFSMVRTYYFDRLLYGQTIWDIRYIFLPRQIFPNKPFIYGKAVFERDLGLVEIYSPGNPLYGPSTVFGQLSELYGNFGAVGILLGMVMWGWFYAFLERYRKTPGDCVAFFIYLVFFFNQLWFFRHGLLGMVQSMIIPTLLAPIFLLLAYSPIAARTSISSGRHAKNAKHGTSRNFISTNA